MSKVDYGIQDKFDVPSFLMMIALVCFGLAAIYSATHSIQTQYSNVVKQSISFGISLTAFFVVIAISSHWIKQAAYPVYGFALFLLVLVLFVGRSIGGAKSWFVFGGFSFQPSELAKLGTILVLADYLHKPGRDIQNLKEISIALGIGLAPVALIMLEPDLGSSFTFFGLLLGMLFWKGIDLFGLFFVLAPVMVAIAALFGKMYFIVGLLIIVVLLLLFRRDIFLSLVILAINTAAGFFVDYLYGILSPHQKKRIDSFVDPNADPLGAGYNSLQAKIAIGSGGIFGKGFLNGNQTQLHFIPEQWTDFIFCGIGEEFGLLGAGAVVLLFVLLFIRILRIASVVRDSYFSLVIIGVLSIYVSHFIINIGMAVGLMPVIGIPLPFVSYGGSSLLTNMVMLGIVFNAYRSFREA